MWIRNLGTNISLDVGVCIVRVSDPSSHRYGANRGRYEIRAGTDNQYPDWLHALGLPVGCVRIIVVCVKDPRNFQRSNFIRYIGIRALRSHHSDPLHLQVKP